MIKMLLSALQSSDDWDVFDAPVESFRRRVKSIKLTKTTSGSTAMMVVKAKGGDAETTGELTVGALEPMAGIRSIDEIGAGVDEFRVYYE